MRSLPRGAGSEGGRRGRGRPMKRLLALVGLVGLVAIGLAAGFATSDVAAGDKLEGPNGEHKVVVCKYVGTPGVDERLQTGNNPITPDANSLPGFTGTF